MNDEKADNAAIPDKDSPEREGDAPSIWQDPNVPIGNAPPLPRWPVGVFAVAWAGWVVFLVVLLVSMSPTAPR